MSNADQTNLAELQARRLENIADQLTLLLRQRESAQQNQSAGDGTEWSGRQVVGHVVEMVPYWLNHVENIIAASEPPTFGRGPDSPERLAGPEHGASADLDTLLSQLYTNLYTAAQRIRTMSDEERSKKGINSRRGEMTAGEIIETFIVAHAQEHLEQAQSA